MVKATDIKYILLLGIIKTLLFSFAGDRKLLHYFVSFFKWKLLKVWKLKTFLSGNIYNFGTFSYREQVGAAWNWLIFHSLQNRSPTVLDQRNFEGGKKSCANINNLLMVVCFHRWRGTKLDSFQTTQSFWIDNKSSWKSPSWPSMGWRYSS